MRVVRPAVPADYDQLMELAVLSGRGFTSLPEDKPTLRSRLDLSAASFAGEVAAPESWFTLMLEDTDTGGVDGVAGVKASVGLKRPFFSFRVVTLAQSSPTLDMRFDHQALVLVKPQFELSREEIGKGGIVREPELHEKACERIRLFVQNQENLEWRGLVESSIQGTDGNREFLAWFARKPQD